MNRLLTQIQLDKFRALVHGYWRSELSIAPLVTFRVLFGLIVAFGAVRFMQAGWVETLLVDPQFYFDYSGFSWIPRPTLEMGYALYFSVALSGLFIALGWYYRFATIAFVCTFTYAQLLDATNYLNHYYLVILLGFLLCFLPANQALSVDAATKRVKSAVCIPAWCIHIIMLQLGLVYFFAGVAKINADWLLRAMPMAIWLPERSWWPVLGKLFSIPATAYVFSWAGMLYDTTIVGWLVWRKSRPIAYLAVLLFHFTTALLFNIGLFPIIMVASTLLFFPGSWHEKVWNTVSRFSEKIFSASYDSFFSLSAKQLSFATLPFRTNLSQSSTSQFDFFSDPIRQNNLLTSKQTSTPASKDRKGVSLITRLFLITFISIQILLPLRSYATDGPPAWSEQGYRFGWRVMLVEKVGFATFTAVNPSTGQRVQIENRDYLTSYQEKQMAIQPDFIVQFAKHIAKQLETQAGWQDPEVYAEVYVALNARRSQLLIDPSIDLTKVELPLIDFPLSASSSSPWILPHQ